MAHIVLDQASVVIDDRQILAPLSLELSEPSIALIGANGSGKSTLARLINGLVTPSSGTVKIDGLTTTKHGKDIRKKVGFIFTNPAAQVVMPTVIEDVMVSLRGSIPDSSHRRERAQNLLDEFGLRDLAHRSVYELSGGQLQLLAIAGVMGIEPEVLVADEPTTLLDLMNARKIGELLLDLGPQLILATHDLELAAKCSRAIVIDHGTIVFDGEAGIACDFYRNLVHR